MKKLIDWMERRSWMSFVLYLVVGAYLFYAINKMYAGISSLRGSAVPIYIFMALFAVIGLVFILAGAFALIGGHYKEKACLNEPTDNDIDEEDTDIE